jgi:predicted amidophosphoribosyltransferase
VGFWCLFSILAPVTGLISVMLWRIRVRERRALARKSPICRKCGYDLRGGKSACPECGEENSYYDWEFWSQK